MLIQNKIKVYFFNPRDKLYQLNQKYYTRGLNIYLKNINTNIIPFYKNIKNEMEIDISQFKKRQHKFVGQYIIKFPEKEKAIKFAIDAHDQNEIKSKKILDWSDVYFKSNKWTSIDYPKKILPIINGNGILSIKRINFLKSLRDRTEKKYDLVFISRVWGGREHSIRLFENIAKVDCKKKLLAIFLDSDKNQPITKEYYKRLKKAGVTWTYKSLFPKKLWNYMANARLCILRAGKHLCIPWRMLDQLCIGSCFFIDTDPFPQWPNSLRKNINYLSLGIKRPMDGSVGPVEDYKKIPNVINNVFNNNNLHQQIRENNADYFDKFASPFKVGEYIINAVRKTI